MCKVIALTYRKCKGGPVNSVQQLFITGEGIEGDVHFGDKYPVSIQFINGKDELEESNERGLCNNRFVPNILVEGILDLQLDTKIEIGGNIFVVVGIKSCYENCPILDKECVLRNTCYFVRQLNPGYISVGTNVVRTS